MNIVPFKTDGRKQKPVKVANSLVALASSVEMVVREATLLDVPPSVRLNIIEALLSSARSIHLASEALNAVYLEDR